MLSYRHGYHAGNHADVLKHIVLLGLLQKLLAKEKPFTYLDSHSGAGLYDLGSDFARMNAEYKSGITPLWRSCPTDPLLGSYLAHIRAFNNPNELCLYPGSPALALACLREQDRMHLLELHTSEVEVLRDNFAGDKRVSVHHRDAYEGLLALTPPEPRRGLALIDPAYEDKQDYQRVVTTMTGMHRRWPVGIIALWYPLLAKQRDRSDWLKSAVSRAGLPEVLSLELDVGIQEEEFGMHGSGMLIVNTPWQFQEQLQATLGELCTELGQGAHFSIHSPSASTGSAPTR